jgi:hypothetical protein
MATRPVASAQFIPTPIFGSDVPLVRTGQCTHPLSRSAGKNCHFLASDSMMVKRIVSKQGVSSLVSLPLLLDDVLAGQPDGLWLVTLLLKVWYLVGKPIMAVSFLVQF